MNPTPDSYSAGSGQSIVVGTPLNGLLGEAIAGMAPDTWLEYTGTNINEMETTGLDGVPTGILNTDGNHVLTQWAGKFGYDPQRRVMFGVGTAEGYASFTPPGGRAKAVYFDLATNAFSIHWNPTGKNEGHVYDGNGSRALNGYAYRKGYNSPDLWRVNLDTRVWEATFTGAGLSPGLGQVVALEVFPDLGAQGSVICVDAARVIRWDVATGVRTVIGSSFSGSYTYSLAIYCEAIQSVLFGAGDNDAASLYLLDSFGTVTPFATTIPYRLRCANPDAGYLLPDPSGRAYAWSWHSSDGIARRINLLTGAWEALSTPPSMYTGGFLDRCVAVPLHGLGAFAWWRGNGLSAEGVSTSTYHVYKVA